MAAPTLAELQTRRNALQKALDSGVLILREGDKHVTYRNANDMRGAIADLERRIVVAGGTVETRGIYVRPGTKGW
jgi:hypothetical protein